MCITAERLRVLAPHACASIITDLAPELAAKLPGQKVDTPLRRAHFLAQICVESGGFRRLVENLNYTSAERITAVWPRLKTRAAAFVRCPQALANAAYANRLGNGDEASGDGWCFRGRGLIQITGRANYRGAGAAIGFPLDDYPAAAAQADKTVLIALWYWISRGCNALADKNDADAITRKINGPGMLLRGVRRSLAAKALKIFV